MKNILSLAVLLSLPALVQAYSHGVSGHTLVLVILFAFWPAIIAMLVLIVTLARHIKHKPTTIGYFITVVLLVVQGVWLLVAEVFI